MLKRSIAVSKLGAGSTCAAVGDRPGAVRLPHPAKLRSRARPRNAGCVLDALVPHPTDKADGCISCRVVKRQN